MSGRSSARHEIQTVQWTSQYHMLLRLLELWAAIIEYFGRYPSNSRRLRTQDWTVVNEACSLLGSVRHAHLSLAIFLVEKLLEVLDIEMQEIKVLERSWKTRCL